VILELGVWRDQLSIFFLRIRDMIWELELVTADRREEEKGIFQTRDHKYALNNNIPTTTYPELHHPNSLYTRIRLQHSSV